MSRWATGWSLAITQPPARRHDLLAWSTDVSRQIAQGTCTVIVELGDATASDLATIDVLARLRLLSRRAGAELRLDAGSAELMQLLDLLGLTTSLAVRPDASARPGGERQRQPEPREHCGVEEVMDVRDPSG